MVFLKDKTKIINTDIQKRTSLEKELEVLQLSLTDDKIRKEVLEIRGKNFSKLFELYHDANDELLLLDNKPDPLKAFKRIQFSYITLLADINEIVVTPVVLTFGPNPTLNPQITSSMEIP